jgi:tRNA A-37 threonylcarbamoyl transferase component Bud32
MISLQNEFRFSRDHYQDFNTEDIGIPRYLHFDVPNELLVIEYVNQSSTLEKTLFDSRKIYRSLPLHPLFYNIGKWLSRFHLLSLNISPVSCSKEELLKEIKPKWMQVFDDQQGIQSDLKFLIEKATSENFPTCKATLHKEYGPGNILHVNNKVYGIDFGTPENGHVLDDIAYFIISVLVLNKYPDHALYKRINSESLEIKSFLDGYMSTSIIDKELVSSDLFNFYLYKNLIRRMSHQFAKARQAPKPLKFIAKIVVNNVFYKTKHSFLPKY